VIDVISDIADDISLGNEQRMSAAQFLRYFLFPNEMHHVFVNKLSGGEKKRLFLMTVLIQNPNFLILDEPTNDLDIFTLNVLEEYLQNFKGCVLIVSHDRYFLDKVSDHLFVFEGEGNIRDFPGNYSDYHENARNEQREKVKLEKKDKPISVTINKTRPKKLSFNEKRELETLENELEGLEQQKEDLQNELNSGQLEAKILMEKSELLGKTLELIEEKELRWLELKEIEEL